MDLPPLPAIAAEQTEPFGEHEQSFAFSGAQISLPVALSIHNDDAKPTHVGMTATASGKVPLDPLRKTLVDASSTDVVRHATLALGAVGGVLAPQHVVEVTAASMTRATLVALLLSGSVYLTGAMTGTMAWPDAPEGTPRGDDAHAFTLVDPHGSTDCGVRSVPGRRWRVRLHGTSTGSTRSLPWDRQRTRAGRQSHP